MVLYKKSGNHQLRGFALAAIAWILCSTSMGLPEWQIWYLENPVLSYTSMAFVGMWGASVCHHNNSSHVRVCHYYNYRDALVPLDIRVAQHLLLVASIVGLVGAVCAVFGLQQLYTEKLQKNEDCNPFVLSAILNAIASIFIFLAVMCNYFTVQSKDRVCFLPSFQLPLFPYAQKAGSAIRVACISGILFLLSAIIFITYSPSMESKMLPHV
ncbi:claudin-34-like [Arvicanthis niloticus]|uniref:claudin-34-like n=1 Tax=Arvicanthis niloticus TaxID=61156 RepID=UPI0014862177|nr:claudin-34-like [Arvicanthis niloticus]